MKERFPFSDTFFAGFALGALVLIATSGNTALVPIPAKPNLSSAETQIRQDVLGAIQKNQQFETYQEWAESGFTPKDVFENISALQDPKRWEYLCNAFSLLATEDLAMFQNEIEDPKSPLPCQKQMVQQLKQYWTASSIALSQQRTLVNMGNAIMPMDEPIATLPSEERHIDAAAGPTLSRGELKDGEIAFTFDDGPHPTRTKAVLQILENAGVRATFFELGGNAREYPEISRLVAQKGHTVASHTHSHPLLTRLSLDKASAEIDRGREEVAQASGMNIPFFRFPYGGRSKALTELVKQKGMASFLWNMDTLDWKLRNPSALFQNVLKELNREKGGIILFHDVHQQTIIVLPQLLEELKLRHFNTILFVPH